MTGRAWLGVPTIGTALLVAAAIASCTYHYAIRNDYSPSLVCIGGKGHHGGHGGRPKPPVAIYKTKPNEVPNAFYITRDPQGACVDYPFAGQGRWAGRAIVRLPNVTYCGYTWLSRPVVPPPPFPITDPAIAQIDPPALGVQQGAEANGTTTMVQSPLISSDEGTWKQARYDVMRARLGAPEVAAPHVSGVQVRVAVVDSASGNFYADDAVAADPAQHGRAVGKLIEDIACSGQPQCGVEIYNYAALNLQTNADEYIEGVSSGGAYGNQQDLADQINLATEQWVKDRATPQGPDHLIINLSVGWSGCWNSSTQSPIDSPVLVAILKATCQGALVVAAGGNVDALNGCPAGSLSGKPVGEQVFPAQFLNSVKAVTSDKVSRAVAGAASHAPSRAALPGSTQGLAALLHPTPQLCAAAGVANAPTGLGPLLVGISAVDHKDRRLSVAAQDSSLVAFGDAVSTPDGDGWTRQLTGTSASAATVSGIAASVWATFPARTPAQLERDLIEPAVVLPGVEPNGNTFLCNALPSDTGPSECHDVRRASLCRSLAHAAGQSSDCAPGVEPTEPSVALAMQSAVPAPECVGAGATADGMCQSIVANAVDSAEQPWGVVGSQPGGQSCRACIYWGPEQTFTGNFLSGSVAVPSIDGVIVFPNNKSFALWNSLSTTTILKELSSTPMAPTSATLKYVRNTGSSYIYYTEGIVLWL